MIETQMRLFIDGMFSVNIIISRHKYVQKHQQMVRFQIIQSF